MPPVRCQPADGRWQHVPLLHLLLLFLSVERIDGYIQIPDDYKYNDIKQPPKITNQAVSQTVFSLDDVNLACEASGDPKPSFRWVKDGNQFGEVLLGSGTLTADKTKNLRFYQGTYRCYAANELGTAVSDVVHVTTEAVPTLPKEKEQKQHQFEEGVSTVLICNPPKSSVTPKIHWMDSQWGHILQSERVTTSLDGNLYFANLVQSDSRNDYICNAHYIKASISLPKKPISISVIPSNSVVKNRQPRMNYPTGTHSSYLILKGQTLTLECIPEGLPTPEVHWEKKDSSLSSTRTKILNYDRQLQIVNVSEKDNGEYVCTARNSQGSVTHHYTVTVEAAPQWTKKPEEHLYAPGEMVKLDCHAEGIPTPNITWSINGVPLSGTDLEQMRSMVSGTLILSNVQYSDTAVYQCEATNKHATILLNTHIHVIELPPQILTADGLVYMNSTGSTIILKCRTFGSPRPKVDWKIFDSSPAVSNAKMSQMANGNLQISNVSQEESGIYTCSVRDSNVTISAVLKVLNRTKIVAPPQHLQVIRGNDAVLQCKFSVDHRLKHPTLQWKKDGHKIAATTNEDKYTEYSNGSLKVSDVQIQDSGEYGCEISTELDSDDASGSITVQDKPGAPLSVEISEKRERSVTLTWTAGDENNSPVFEYIIEMKEEQCTDASTWREYERVHQDIKHIEIHLQPFCKYHFRVRAVNEIGNSEPSSESESYITPAAKVPPQILTADGLVYRKTTGSTVILKCRTFGSPRPKVDWEIFDSSPAVSNAKMSQMANGNLQISNVSQEESGIYTCSVRDSNVTISAILEVFNRTKIVTPPQHLRVIRGNDAVLQCKYSMDHKLKHPTLQWKKDGHKIAASANEDKYTEYPNGSLKVTDLQIQDSGEYGCEISTELDSDDASGSITVQDKPGAPLSVEISEKRERSVTLTWTAGDENNSPVFEYIIEMKEEQCTDASTWREYERVHQDIKQIEIHLQPFCKYHFRVRAVNEIGNSEPSSESESYITPAAKLPPQILTADGLVYRNTTGSTIVLECRTFGSPRPKVDWKIFDSSPALSNAKMSQMANGNLQISNVSQEDSGNYTCSVRDSNMAISAILEVFNRTKIVTPPQHLRVVRGNDAVLQCKYSVDHQLKHLTIQWKKDGHKIAASVNDEKYTEYPNGSLKVTDVQIQDSGEYGCEISTELDSDDASGSITVQDKPGAPLSVEISEKRERSVTLTWTTGDENNSPVFEYIIEMKEEQCTDASTWREYKRVHQDIKHIEIHLQPFCKYHFRVRAVNEIGNSEPSSESESYITPAAKLPPQILTADGLVYRKTTGSTVVLKCRTFGSPRPKVDWEIFDSSPAVSNAKMSQMANGNLQISNVSQEDSGNYTCLVRDSNVTISAILEVFNKTKIVAPPQHLRVVRGNDAVLQCKFSVDHRLKHPTLQWKKDGHKIAASANEDKYTEYPSGSLKVTDVQIQDSGEYSCEISTELDSDDASGSITVQDKPGAPLSVEISEKRERSVTLTWTAGDENNSPVSEYIIEMKEEQCTDASTWREYERVHQDIKQIEIHLQPFCKYHFRVRAVNEIGNSEPSSESESYFTPAAKLPPQILTADGLVYRKTTGSTVILKCRTSGSPRPKVDWEIFDSSPAVSNAKMSQMANGNLQISNVSQKESGIYTCLVRDSNVTISAILEVFNRTKIVTPPQHLRVVRGNDAILQCKYSVDHKLKHLTLQWKKDGHKIAASVNDEKYTEFPSGSLKVTDVQIQDSGEYGCEISTELDSDDASGSITVQDKPGAPLSVEISEKRERSVTLTWTAGDENNSPVFEYIIEMKEEQCTDASTWREYERVYQDIKHIEIHLQPFCKYHFRVRAVNEIGNSEPSSESESYITPAAKPDMNPENVTSVSTDPNSMIITWKELKRREFNGAGFKYKVHWRQASGRDLHWKESIVSGPPLIVNDTGTFIPFEIKVLAVNDEGTGPEPVAKHGYSGEDIPLEAPSGVTVEELPSNKTIIRVRWSPVTRESVRGHLLGYKIHLRRKGPRTHFHRGQERDEERRVLKVYGNKDEEVVSGLQFYSNYTLTVTAFNGKGEGPHSDPHHFSTPEGAPGPLTDLYFESLSGTQITLRWQTPHKPNGVITGYVLKYQEILDGNSSPRQVEYIDLPAVTKFTVDNLNPQSRYLFNLRARNSAGVGEPIIREGATMLYGEPPSVINMTVGETPVNLSWGPEDKHQNFAFSFGYLKKEYIIEMKEEQCTDASTWRKYERVHQDIKHIKIHLQPFCKYHFRVRAVNEMRNSEPSSESESYITPAAKLPPQILTADWLVYRKPTGSTVVLECRTFGSPRPKVDWEIFDSSPAVSNAKMSQMANGNLQISNVSQKESGIYTCSVRDSNVTISAVLKVFNRSKIVAPPQHLWVIRGNDAVLQCKYSVDHQLKHLTLQWKKDGHKIAASANDDKYTEYSNGSLKVTDVQIQDSGEYSCEISTELDSDDASGSITVQDKPGAPLSVEMSEKRERSVTLTWTAGDENNSPVFEYIIEMKEEQCTDVSTWREYERVHQDIKHIEINLQPFCKYHFRVRAVNEIGNSEPSSESESYITPAAKPDMNPENVTSVSTDPNSMIITWKELERRKFNGPEFKYMVYWRQASGNDPYWKESIVSGPPLIVNDTGTFIPFEIKVLAVNDEGTGPDPVIKLGYSGEDIPFEAPSGVTIEELPSNKTIIRVRWSPVSRESVRGHLLGYKIHLRRNGPRTHFHRGQERDEERRVLEVYGNKDEEVVSGLQFYSNYTLTVTAFNGKGEGPHSDPHHFSTPEGAPGPLTDLYFESLSGSQITLHWQTPHKPNGVITGYLLQYQEIVDENLQVESIDLPVITEFTVDNLDPQSRYLFNLRARNSAGVGEPIIREGATMLDGEPPSVINMTVGETSVNLSWVPGDRHRNFAFSFRYLKKVSGGDWEKSEPVNSTQAFYQLQGLEPGTHYHLRIQSGNTSHDWDFQTKGLGTDLTELLKPKGLQAPGPLTDLYFESLSGTQITLRWQTPHKPNGVITGYLLQYQEILDGNSSPRQVESIDLPAVTEFTVDNLDPQSRYLFNLRARNSAGVGEPIIREGATMLDGVSGGDWEESEPVNSTQAFYQLQGLEPGTHYHIQIQSGNTSHDWDFQTKGPELEEQASGFATQGWFIGLISAVVLIHLVLLILCFIKRRKRGKHSVKDKEEGQAEYGARPMNVFGEYSDNEEKHSISQPSVCESKRSSNDSLADYSNSVDIQFNEDSTFFGQYSGRRDAQGHGDHESSGATFPMNPYMPPPSISFPNSFTGILGPN